MYVSLPHTVAFFLIVFFFIPQVFAQNIRPSQCYINGTRSHAITHTKTRMTFDFPYNPRVTDGWSEEAVREAVSRRY
jgi:hypothetical protein